MSTKTPESELQVIRELITSWKQRNYPVEAVAFRVGQCIIAYADPALMQQVPEKVADQLKAMIAEFKERGEVFSYSSAGEVDHTEYVRKLIAALET